MGWCTKRKEPYTQIGITRLRCIRCGGMMTSQSHQWQICSDGNNWRPLCLDCDIEMNRMVLQWMRHPEAGRLAAEYEAKSRNEPR